MADSDVLLGEITLIGDPATARLTDAVLDGVTLTRTIDGASTLEFTVVDTDRKLTRSGIFSHRSWAQVAGLGYELVAVDKTADRLALTFEDSLVAALRRRDSPRSWSAGSITRAGLIADLCAEIPVPSTVDPASRPVIAAAVERSAADQKDDSWTLLGTLSSDAGWRRFSTGTQIVAGSDAWLATRAQPLTLREHSGAVQGIDYRYDTGRDEATATLTLDATRDAAPIGSTVTLPDLGPASGVWVVSKFTRDMIRRRASLDLIRAAPVLPEPAPPPPEAAESNAGEADFLPGSQAAAPPEPAPAPATSSSAREVFIRAAMSKNGLPYVWGGNYDCSSLLQYAFRVAGRPISRVVGTQAADARARGKVISVAEGLRTRGAILSRLPNEHTAISLGDGSTFEARGRAYPIGRFQGAARRSWNFAYIWV